MENSKIVWIRTAQKEWHSVCEVHLIPLAETWSRAETGALFSVYGRYQIFMMKSGIIDKQIKKQRWENGKDKK